MSFLVRIRIQILTSQIQIEKHASWPGSALELQFKKDKIFMKFLDELNVFIVDFQLGIHVCFPYVLN
jgi:hypothetical protein